MSRKENNNKSFKKSLPEIYKNQFFETCIWAWIAALRKEGKTIQQAVDSFREYWDLTEDNAAFLSLSQTYQRKQTEYRNLRKNNKVEIEMSFKTLDQTEIILEEIQALNIKMQILLQNRGQSK